MHWPEHLNARQLRKYGLTEEQGDALLSECGRHCPACLKPFSPTRPPAVDHEHAIGLVRGLLCVPCNYAIGERHDDRGWFDRVAKYLRHYPTHRLGITVYVPGSVNNPREDQR